MASSRVCVQALWLDFQGVALQRDLSASCISSVPMNMHGGPASAMRPRPTKGTARRCYGRRGSGRKPGMVMECSMG